VTELTDGRNSTLTVEQQVKQIFADKLQRPVAEIRLEDDLLMDLGLDSLSLAEMTVHCEELAGHRLPGETLFDARTVGDLVQLVSHELQSAGVSAQPLGSKRPTP
jgi:acyl carrier protein